MMPSRHHSAEATCPIPSPKGSPASPQYDSGLFNEQSMSIRKTIVRKHRLGNAAKCYVLLNSIKYHAQARAAKWQRSAAHPHPSRRYQKPISTRSLGRHTYHARTVALGSHGEGRVSWLGADNQSLMRETRSDMPLSLVS